MNDKVELGKKFKLFFLTIEEDFSGQKVFQVLVIYDSIYKKL